MNAEVLSSFVPVEKAGGASNLFTDLQTIRVLIYTDDPQVTETLISSKSFGVGLLLKFLNAHQPAFAHIEVTLLSRNTNFFDEKSGHAKNLLTDPLLSGFDQVWFFGIHRANLTQFTTDPLLNFRLRGGPRSELLPDEVASLKALMKTGGVLVAGDHAEDTPSFLTTDPSNLPKTLALGRALGNRIPRAHQLRTWENGPTSDSGNSYDTQEPDGTTDLNDTKLESDQKPQRLILARFDGKQPHQLFKAADGSEIDVFPDHTHEGKIGIPDSFDGDWVGTPKPVIVAYGTDKRTPPAIYNLVIAYDGDTDGVGRIVAHSTWHHFLTLNLSGFDSDPTSTTKGSVADRIGQYYSNLAYWLAPLSKRQAISQSMFWWLASHPLLMEEASSDPLRIGTVALTLLRTVSTPFEIQELLLAHTPPGIRAQRDGIHFPAEGNAPAALPSQELLLGSVISRYYHQSRATAAEAAAVAKEGISTNGSGAPEVIRAGLADGFRARAQVLTETQAAAAAYLEHFG
jgi:hypothetical protein